MKYLIGFGIGIGIMLIVAMFDNGHIGWDKHLSTVFVEGDEMPGLGSDDSHQPDTCFAWVDHRDNQIHIANSAWMHYHQDSIQHQIANH